MRKIRVIGDITHDAYLRFTKRMDQLEQVDEDINLVLCSDGGNPMVALAFYERIKMSICPVTVTATGLVASAAVIILAAGKYRRMTKSAWVMVHDGTPDEDVVKNKRVGQLEAIAKQERRMEEQWNRILAENTQTSIDKWDELHKNETYLSAEECLELGLIEEII